MSPLTLQQAAKELGICKRSLTTWLGQFPYYERRGIRKVFYRKHIDALREAIDRCSRSQPTLQPASGKLAFMGCSRGAPILACCWEPASRRDIGLL